MKPDSITGLVGENLRRVRRTPLVWAGAAALAAQAWTGAARLGWHGWSAHWGWVPAALALVILADWFRRSRRLTETAIARELDDRWQLQARLETAIELADKESAVAAAQRVEAAQQADGRGATSSWAWRGGLALLAVTLAFFAAENAVVLIQSLRARAALAAAANPKDETRATFVWKSPEPQIMAMAIEEVPLAAYAESNTGFRSVSLEVEVNGERAPSRPLDAAALAQPGGYDLEASLYLDELGVKEFDVVSYHLSGVPAADEAEPAVVSALQFIQIRPVRRDLALQPATGDGALISMIRQLKGAQMHLLQQTFALAHASALKRDSIWQTENTRVATEQGALAVRAGEARALAAERNAPALATSNLEQTQNLMKDAAGRIADADTARAPAPQHRAIALLAELEQLIGRAVGGPPVAADPFQDPQRFEILSREATPAGELAALAQRQQQANQDRSGKGVDPSGSGRGPADEQAAIAREAARLLESGGLEDTIRGPLEAAATAAAKAAEQLKANDPQAAREPAAAAQAAFEQALAAQDQAGRFAALATLDEVRRSLNAAGRANPVDRAAALVRAHADLRTTASQQQRHGSAEAARRFTLLADAVQAPKGKSSEAPDSVPDSVERVRELAAAAARVQVELNRRVTALNRTVRQLRRVESQLAAGSSGPSTLADTELEAQEAEWLTPVPETTELARKLMLQADALQRATGEPDAAGLVRVAATAEALARVLEQARDLGLRDEIVRRFNAEDVDPVYREAVETYFERLSREGAKRGATP
jgi:hypothetical protein